jgi:16S rRNA (cytosine967-C5)-methyltransferase
VALEALVAVERGARANLVVPDLLGHSALDQRDRHLVTELVYGTCRMRRACDWLVDRYARGRLDSDVRCAMRLGAYQLGWTRIPAHAAVSATVSEVSGPGRSVVNAVLRRVADDVGHGLVVWPDAATELSYPDWIIEQLQRDIGPSDAVGALRTMNEAASVAWRQDGYAQDPASQMVASHLRSLLGNHLNGARILDLCAAPGGKATALASPDRSPKEQSGPPRGAGGPSLVVASDVSWARTRLMDSNIQRLRTTNVVPVVADGSAPPFRDSCFDLVLVDAPCSGLGVLRRRPDARWRVRREDVETLSALQRTLVRNAVPLLDGGGILAYSVCTLTTAETAGMDNWLATSFPQLSPLPPPRAPWAPAGRGALLLPQAAGTDGMYLICLRATP